MASATHTCPDCGKRMLKDRLHTCMPGHLRRLRHLRAGRTAAIAPSQAQAAAYASALAPSADGPRHDLTAAFMAGVERGRDIELRRARAVPPECPRCAELERSSGEMRSAMAALTGESRARAGAAFEAERARDRDVHRATPY